MTTPSIARQLGQFVSELRIDQIPSAAVETAKLGVLDVLGAALYGATTEWGRLVREYAIERGPQPTARAAIWGAVERCDPVAAALVNGTAAHSAELDDLHKASLYHPSAAVVPAALAIADDLGGVSGGELLTAVVAGYEVGARTGMALGQGHFLRGYHPQGSVGVFAAAAAAARQSSLTAEQSAHALAIAGTQASGLMSAQEGAMAKRLHAGLACESGVRATALATRGFTGADHVYEAPFGGLLATLGTTDSAPGQLLAGLGTIWETCALEFKMHAACAAIHSCLDVIAALKAPASPREVESVTVRTTTHGLLHCGFEYTPGSVTSAQMSFQYCVAAMLTFGRVSIEQFHEDLIADRQLVDLASRVRIEVEPEFDSRGSHGRHAVGVEIHTVSGSVLSGQRDSRRGGVDDPFSREEVIAKFHELATAAGAPGDDILDLVLDLDECDDTSELSRLLQMASHG